MFRFKSIVLFILLTLLIAAPITAAPYPPTRVSTSNFHTTGFTVNWQHDYPDATGYVVEVSGTGVYQTYNVPVSVRSVKVTGLPSGRKFEVRVGMTVIDFPAPVWSETVIGATTSVYRPALAKAQF